MIFIVCLLCIANFSWPQKYTDEQKTAQNQKNYHPNEFFLSDTTENFTGIFYFLSYCFCFGIEC